YCHRYSLLGALMQNSFIGLWHRLLLSPGGATVHRHRRALLCSTISSRQLTGSNPWSLCEEMTGLLIALRAARILLEVRTLEMLELSLDLAIRVL
ncbi:hypothetical protein JTM05_38085, partial [Pseudomonas aeruginosa]|nr:hypothetical protein [Pseudomonas aeruginosa]